MTPDITGKLRVFLKLSGGRVVDEYRIAYEWDSAINQATETDVCLKENRRLNSLEHHVSNPNRRLFYIFQTSVLGDNSLEPIQTSESIRNRRLFL